MDANDIGDLTASLFTPGGALHGRYTPAEGVPFTPIPGAVAGWQAPIFPAGAISPRIIRAYAVDVPDAPLVRAHWRNEVRALLRLSSAAHPSLPRFHEGSYLHESKLGFVILDDPGIPVVDGHPVRARMLRDPVDAFRRWFALLEAATLIGDEGLIHRSISPLSVSALQDEEAPVVLDGFQMSTFVAAWVSRATTEGRSPWLEHLVGPSLACLAPERAGPLVGKPRQFTEGYRGDVFGLGMLGVLWLAPPTPDWASRFSATNYDEPSHLELAGFPRRDANFPSPSETWTHSKKAARRSRLVAAFSLWCTPVDSND